MKQERFYKVHGTADVSCTNWNLIERFKIHGDNYKGPSFSFLSDI